MGKVHLVQGGKVVSSTRQLFVEGGRDHSI